MKTSIKKLYLISIFLSILTSCVSHPELNTPTYYDPNQKTSGFEVIPVNEKTTFIKYYADPVYTLEEAEQSWNNYSEKYCNTEHYVAKITSSGYSKYQVKKTNYTIPTGGDICPGVMGISEADILSCLLEAKIISVLSPAYISSIHSYPLVEGLVTCN